MTKKLSISEFKIKANRIHNNFYDYSIVKYINAITKITIICPIHGEFKQTPAAHLTGRGCVFCGRERTVNSHRKSSEFFLEQAKNIHNDKYDYSKMKFVDLNTKITIICPEHGEFQQKPSKHIMGQGCGKCKKYKLRGSFQLSQEEFIKRARKKHGNKYKYSKVKYVNAHKKIIIICPKHGEFHQEPNSHIYGNGCPKCAYSNKSKKALKWLDSISPNIEKEKPIGRFIVDGFKNNTIYEFYGDFWHGNPEVFDQDCHNKKNGIKYGELYKQTIERAKILISLGYDFIYKWETEHDMKVGKKFKENK